jgi:acetoin utilization deacetylase AcuC-like enzyme
MRPPRRTAILRSKAFLGHDTGAHVERAARIVAIERELERRGLVGDRLEIPCTVASNEAVLRVHDPDHLAQLRKWTAGGGGWIDPDTVMREDSLEVALTAAGGAVNAVTAIVSGSIDRAFLVARPPGHHATADAAMGFCLLNTVAIATGEALALGLRRIAIIDWDVHHGNGTQDIFYGSRDVLYCSLHQSPFYPGTGSAGQTGTGDGKGFTVNCPLPAGTTDATFLQSFRDRVVPAVEAYNPELVIVSAGYDASEHDPLGGMLLTREGFRTLMAETTAIADRHAGGRVLAVLEGGYDPRALAECVADAIEVLDRSG